MASMGRLQRPFSGEALDFGGVFLVYQVGWGNYANLAGEKSPMGMGVLWDLG
jgi:hypothetical protein